MRFGIPPRELLQRITARELAEYEELFALDPWDESRADLRTAIVAATLANINRDPKKGKPFRPVDFMPYADKEALKRADASRLAAELKGALGAKAVRKNKRKRRP